jgi:tripartite-type tricarboxylate transporter receptor subunit TctC
MPAGARPVSGAETPILGDFVLSLEASASIGVGAPRGTSTEIIQRLNNETNGMLADPKTEARLADLGAEVLALSPADFGKLLTEETEKWAKVIKFAGIKAD